MLPNMSKQIIAQVSILKEVDNFQILYLYYETGLCNWVLDQQISLCFLE